MKTLDPFLGRLAAPLELKTTGSEKSGRFEGYASTRKLDSDRDIVQPGAFKRTIDHIGSKGLPLLWFHRPDVPIGGIKLLGEDEHGLVVEGECDVDTQHGHDVYSGMVKGYIDRMSIGYQAKRARFDPQRKARLLDEVALREISAITKGFAANDEALITGLKSASATIRSWMDSYGHGQSVDVYVHEREVRDLIEALTELLSADALAVAQTVADSATDDTKDSAPGSRNAHPAADIGAGSAQVATLLRDTAIDLKSVVNPDEAKALSVMRQTLADLRG